MAIEKLWPKGGRKMTGFLFFLAIAFFLVGGAVLQGLRKIPADPPQIAAVTRWGKRTGEFKKEGWRFFPGYPYFYGFILVDMTKKNQDLPNEVVRTPDLAEVKIPVSITWTPLDEELINYLNSGGEKGVKAILEDIVRERIREWAISDEEGPGTWEDALKSRGDAVTILVKAIIGEELPKIPSSVPTSVLLKYFDQPRKSPIKSEVKKWGQKWEEVAKKIEEDYNNLPQNQRTTPQEFSAGLKEKIEERRAIINGIRQGNGNQIMPQLGIILNRLNIGEMAVTGEVAKAAELRAKEEKEREGEILELEHIAKRIKGLKKSGFSGEQALEVIQTERDKVKKLISETKINVSEETRKTFENIASAIGSLLKKGGKDG
jgi:regulator of protease activity HflC (stomatin/prohibitin superfamily)